MSYTWERKKTKPPIIFKALAFLEPACPPGRRQSYPLAAPGPGCVWLWQAEQLKWSPFSYRRELSWAPTPTFDFWVVNSCSPTGDAGGRCSRAQSKRPLCASTASPPSPSPVPALCTPHSPGSAPPRRLCSSRSSTAKHLLLLLQLAMS